MRPIIPCRPKRMCARAECAKSQGAASMVGLETSDAHIKGGGQWTLSTFGLVLRATHRFSSQFAGSL